jgi:hypothetical protein
MADTAVAQVEYCPICPDLILRFAQDKRPEVILSEAKDQIMADTAVTQVERARSAPI